MMGEWVSILGKELEDQANIQNSTFDDRVGLVSVDDAVLSSGSEFFRVPSTLSGAC